MFRILPLVFLSTTALTFPQTTPSSTPNPRLDGKELDQNKHSAAQDAAKQQVDELLATSLIVCNNNTVALAQLAQQKSKDPVVKQFAQKVIDDHRQFLLELQPFASGAGVKNGVAARDGSNRDSSATDGSNRDGSNLDGSNRESDDRDMDDGDDRGVADRQGQPKQVQDASFGRNNGAFDHVSMIKELGEQNLQSARGELEKKQGAEFDRCYMAMAVGAHMQANDMLTVFQKHVSSPLKAVLSKGQTMVTKHLQEAKVPAMEIDGKETAVHGSSAK